MLFSLLDANRILRFDPKTGGANEVRRHTNRTSGLVIGPDGTLYGCQESGRKVVRFLQDGSATPLAYTLDGAYHNQPQDVTIGHSGRLWFADTRGDRPVPGPQIFPLLDFSAVLRLERMPNREWAITRVTYDTKSPTAVLISNDEKTLYVAEGTVREQEPRTLRAYPIDSDGRVGMFTVLCTFGSDHRGPHRGVTGMCFNAAGNIVTCSGWGRSGPGPLISVLTSAGAVIESHAFPSDMPMRCCFGDDDLSSLYVTSADGCLYRARSTGNLA